MPQIWPGEAGPTHGFEVSDGTGGGGNASTAVISSSCQGATLERERERERKRWIYRERDRGREGERERQTKRERGRQRERERERDRQTDRQTDRQKEREREREGDRERERYFLSKVCIETERASESDPRDRLSGPVRDTPPYRAMPFRDWYCRRGLRTHLPCFHRVSRKYRLDTPFEGRVSHLDFACSPRRERSENGRGYRTQLAMLRHQKPHSAQGGYRGDSLAVTHNTGPLRGQESAISGAVSTGVFRILFCGILYPSRVSA